MSRERAWGYLTLASWTLIALAALIGWSAMGYVHFALHPESDAAAGVLFLGGGFAFVADLVAAVLAGVALFAGRGQRARGVPLAPLAALVVGLLSAVATPIVGLFFILASSPVPVH